jgi:AraC family transcriptional regulator
MTANEEVTATLDGAWPVSGIVKGNREMKVYELHGGKMVHTIHKGPYESCELTYLKLFAWIEPGDSDIRSYPGRISQSSPARET